MDRSRNGTTAQERWLGVALAALVVAAYLPALRAGWIWDDDSYVTGNAVLAASDGWWRVFVPRETPQYYPLVFLGFWIERQLFGLEPAVFHFVNVALHATCALLVFRLARRLALPGAWFVAALFALHPVHVESVAWVTERKNVLSGVFWAAAALAWFRFDEAPAGRRARPAAATLAWFLAALLSKSVTCSLPAVLILLHLGLRKPLARRHATLLAPLFAVGLALALHTAHLERTHVGARGEEFAFTFVQRLLIASKALCFYAAKLVVPWPLIFVYPRFELDPARPLAWLPALLLVAAGATALLAWRRGARWPAVALALFAGTLFPALGFFDVYPMRYSFVADHFQYLASLAALALAAGGAATFAARRGRAARQAAGLAGAAIVALLAAATWQRCHAFADAGTLWRDTLAKNDSAWIAHNNLALLDVDEGRPGDALARLERALPLATSATAARQIRLNRATTLGKLGRHVEALAEFEALASEGEPVELKLAVALDRVGRGEEARARYLEAIERHDDPAARLFFGIHLLADGRPEEAIAPLERSVEQTPANADARMVLADAYAAAGRLDAAIAAAQAALEILGPDAPARAVEPIRRRIAQWRAPAAGAPRR